MTALLARRLARRVGHHFARGDRADEGGSALVIALIFIGAWSLVIFAILGFAETGFKLAAASGDQRDFVYAADAGTEAAIGYLASGGDPAQCPPFTVQPGDDDPITATLTCTDLAGDPGDQTEWFNPDGDGFEWTARKAVTILADQVAGDPDVLEHTDFPVLVSIVDPELVSVAGPDPSGPLPDGSDLVFVDADVDPQAPLSHEIEKYDPLTGELVAWVKVPVLSTTDDTVLYLYYGNPAPPAPDPLAAAAVWSSGYRGVWHMSDTAPPPTPPDPALIGVVADSTIWVNDGTALGAMPDTAAVDGKIAGALSFDGSDAVQVPDAVAPALNADSLDVTSLTVSAWVFKRTAPADGTGRAMIATRQLGDATDDLWSLYDEVTAPDETYLFWANAAAAVGPNLGDDGEWVYLAGTYDEITGTLTLYRNGIEIGTVDAVPPTALASEISALCLAAGASDATGACNSEFLDAILDETRLADLARSAEWIATEFANQSQDQDAPFLTVAAAQAITAPGAPGEIKTYDVAASIDATERLRVRVRLEPDVDGVLPPTVTVLHWDVVRP